MSQPREKLEPPALSPLERQLLLKPSQTSKPNIGTLPSSSVLSKVRSFLPQMQQANEQLQQQLQSCDPSVVDIEHIPGGADADAPVIQMDLACGLLDLKDDAALAAAQRAIAAGGEVAVEAYDGGGSDSSSGSDEDAADEIGSSSSSGDSVPDDSADADHRELQEDDGAPAAGGALQQQVQTGGAVAAGSSSRPQQQQQQQQQQSKARRKVKAKRPMILELS